MPPRAAIDHVHADLASNGHPRLRPMHGFVLQAAGPTAPPRATWAHTLGPDRLRALEADLRTITDSDAFRLDVPGWFGP